MDKTYAKKLYVPTRYGDHLGVFEPDEKKGFIVTVPSLPGVVTWGRNITHAKKMAQEAIELCIECRAGEAIRHVKTRFPHPQIKANPLQRTHEFITA